MNTARKGNSKENRTAELLEAEGWIVGSRRHRKGGGDWLATRLGDRPMLVEVKATQTRFAHFGREDRTALRNTAAVAGATAILAWWAPRARVHELVPASEWPGSS